MCFIVFEEGNWDQILIINGNWGDMLRTETENRTGLPNIQAKSSDLKLHHIKTSVSVMYTILFLTNSPLMWWIILFSHLLTGDKITPLVSNRCTFCVGLDLLSNNNLHKDQLFDSKSAEFYRWIEVILSIWRSVCQTSHCEKTKMCVCSSF